MENEATVRQVVTQAMTNRRLLDYVREQIAMHRRDLEHFEKIQREAERERDRYNREIRGLGFHDIGHARGDINKLDQGEHGTMVVLK